MWASYSICLTKTSCKQLCWFPGYAGENNLDFFRSLVAFGISNFCYCKWCSHSRVASGKVILKQHFANKLIMLPLCPHQHMANINSWIQFSHVNSTVEGWAQWNSSTQGCNHEIAGGVHIAEWQAIIKAPLDTMYPIFCAEIIHPPRLAS